MASVLQSPKDAPIEFFQESGRPLSARMSDKPGGAFSGLRARSFSLVKAPPRARVSSIEEENSRAARGEQPLVPDSNSGFGRSESSIGTERQISTRRITGSTSGEGVNGGPYGGDLGGGGAGGIGRGRSGRYEREARRRSSRSRSQSRGSGASSGPSQSSLSSTSQVEKRTLLRGGSRGLGSPPPADSESRAHALLRSQHNSVGTALHAVDHADSLAAERVATAVSSTGGKVTTSAPRRVSSSGPVGRRMTAGVNGHSSGGGRGGAGAAVSGFDSPSHDRAEYSGGHDDGGGTGGTGGGSMLPRRSSASHLPTTHAMTSNFDSVTTVGTPAAGPSWRASARMSHARGAEAFGQRGR